MDPGQLAADLVQKNFSKFGTFRKVCIYQEMGEAVNDPETGIIDRPVLSTKTLYMIFDLPSVNPFRNRGMNDDDSVYVNSEIAIFPSLDLLPIVPKLDDIIIRADSSQWTVVGKMPDPKPATYQLLIKPYLDP